MLNSKFDNVRWTPNHLNDFLTIERPSDLSYCYAVQISPSRSEDRLMGINIQNCGTIRHINAGPSAICFLTNKNPVITFSSDKDNVASHGVYQLKNNS
jgi:hypothetical protein